MILPADKIIVAGGRDFDDKMLMMLAMERRIAVGDEIVNGMCKTGADLLARQYAERFGHPVKPFPANWYPDGPGTRLDRSAGPRRNEEMAKYGDVLIAFWDGYSRGTMSMIQLALQHGCEIHVYRYSNE